MGQLDSQSRFQFISVIGCGSFGKVWKVVDNTTGDVCALKIMDKATILEKKSLQTVLMERKILQVLASDRSDLISNIKAAFQDKEKLYILMQFISGRNLRAYLTTERKLNENQIKFIIIILLKIVRYIHSNNIIHGDIKPENIMIDHRGFPHITDFGIASFFRKNNRHCDGGTLPYMAPEVIEGLNHNYSIDTYALGIITFELFFQHRPHHGDTFEQLKEDILSKTINLHSCPELSTISAQAADFIIKLTDPDADTRLGNASISEVFQHPWISSNESGSLIIKNDISIFEENKTSPQHKEAEEIYSQQSEANELMRKLLDRQYIQKMFEPFNYTLVSTPEPIKPFHKDRRPSLSLTAKDLRQLRNQSIRV